MNILQAMADRNLFAPWFRTDTYAAWRAFLAALFALPMDDEQAALFRQHTDRTALPATPSREAWLVCGRRAGKSFMMALVAVYLATFRRYRRYLAPGERATIMVIAADRRQARVVLRYIRALLREVPMLAKMIERETAEAFDLSNSVTIEVGTASFRSTRGYTFAAVIGDEIAFWPSEDAAEPDYAILEAIRPGMATIPGSLLLCASSPYARRGALFDAFREHWGVDGAPLVWRAATREMNPAVPQEEIDRAMARDAAWARAEYLAGFRADIEAFVRRELVEGVVSSGVTERPPVDGARYVGFVDPSGGASDSFTLAIGHREGDMAVLDATREQGAPFSPETTVAAFAATLRSYRVTEVVGDRYAGEWPREAFRRHGIAYRTSDRSRSELYRDMLPAFTSGTVDLLDDDRLVGQLVRLERRATRGGREIIDHQPGGHDDLANVVAGVTCLLADPVDPPGLLIGAMTFNKPEPAFTGNGLPFSGLDYIRGERS